MANAINSCVASLLCVYGPLATAGEPPHQKLVGTDWVWFTDYAFFRSEWTVNAETDCELEVGSGMKVRGKPRGNILRFSEHITFVAWGVGAIHIRAVAGLAPCEVRVDMGKVDLIPIFGNPSVIKGLIKDGKIVYDSRGGPKHEFESKP